MPDTAASTTAAPWTGSTDGGGSAPPQKFPWARLLPAVGPLLLFIIWDIAVRFGLIKAILLPTPYDTLIALVTGLPPALLTSP